MFSAVLPLIRPYRGLATSPLTSVKLWSEGGRGIWINSGARFPQFRLAIVT